MRTHIPFALLATALACSLFAAPAHALRARVYVSKAGADVGACSFSAPCQSLGYALSAVEPSGEITILDSGGYNPITINKGVTITVPPGVEAGIAAPAGGTAITMSAGPNDAVALRGLTLQGGNSAFYGIVVNAGAKIEIIDCVVRDFLKIGISMSFAGTGSLIHISNTRIMNNAEVGIFVQNTTYTASFVSADFDHLTVIDNNNYGIEIGPYVDASIKNSDVSNNGGNSGCNIEIYGGTPKWSTLTARNVTFNEIYSWTSGGGPANPLQCSINQDPNTAEFLTENEGGALNQNQNSLSVELAFTDGTNTMEAPGAINNPEAFRRN